MHLHLSAGSSKVGRKWGNPPLNRTKPTEVVGLMKVGLTAAATRTASEAWLVRRGLARSVSTAAAHWLAEEKTAQSVLRGGGGGRGVDSKER